MKFLTISIFALFLFTSVSFSQTPDKIVDIKVTPKTKVIKPGSLVDIEILLDIKKGWHINANKPMDKNLIPTEVSFTDGSSFTVVKTEYPQPIITTLAFSENELALYEFESVIKLQVKIDKNFKKDKLVLNGEVQYQPCNDQTCLFPYTKKFTTELKISKK